MVGVKHFMHRIVPMRDLRPAGDHDTGEETCVSNISPEERLGRLRFGIIQMVFTLAVLAVMIVLDVHPLWRLALYPLFSAAAAGYFQWRDKT